MMFLCRAVCYQHEASGRRANEEPGRDANEARFQKLLVNAHIYHHRVSPPPPPPPLVCTVTQS